MLLCKNRNENCPLECVHYSYHEHRHHHMVPKECADCLPDVRCDEAFEIKSSRIHQNLLMQSMWLVAFIAQWGSAGKWSLARARALVRAKDRLKRIADKHYARNNK